MWTCERWCPLKHCQQLLKCSDAVPRTPLQELTALPEPLAGREGLPPPTIHIRSRPYRPGANISRQEAMAKYSAEIQLKDASIHICCWKKSLLYVRKQNPHDSLMLRTMNIKSAISDYRKWVRSYPLETSHLYPQW